LQIVGLSFIADVGRQGLYHSASCCCCYLCFVSTMSNGL